MTNRQRLDKAEDLNVRCTIDGRIGNRRRRNMDYSGARSSDSDHEQSEYDDPDSNSFPTSIDTVSMVDFSSGSVPPEKQAQSAVGGALKRNPDGTLIAPRVVKKKESGKKVVVPCDLISSITYPFPPDNLPELEAQTVTICSTRSGLGYIL